MKGKRKYISRKDFTGFMFLFRLFYTGINKMIVTYYSVSSCLYPGQSMGSTIDLRQIQHRFSVEHFVLSYFLFVLLNQYYNFEYQGSTFVSHFVFSCLSCYPSFIQPFISSIILTVSLFSKHYYYQIQFMIRLHKYVCKLTMNNID